MRLRCPPPNNQQLRDETHYPFIRIDVQSEYPRLELTRTPVADKALYFGACVNLVVAAGGLLLSRRAELSGLAPIPKHNSVSSGDRVAVASWSLLVFVSGSSLQKVAAFVSEKLSTIEGVLSTATHFLLRSYKEQGFLMEVQAEENNRLKVAP